MNLENKQRQTKRSWGFLLWGGFLIVSALFFSSRGAAVFSSGSGIAIFVYLLGIGLTLGICVLWYFVSGRRQKRSEIVRAIGLTFFALGSAAPIFLIGESSLRGFGAVPVSGQELLDLDALVMGIIVTAVFLTPAYFLCFRIRSFRPKHQCLVSNTETVDGKMNPGS